MEIKVKVENTGHWYTTDGQPAYTQVAKNGNIRSTTLRDAKAKNLIPSVTTILNVAAKPALQTWLQTQVLLSALTLPRNPDESEQDWIERVMVDSKATGKLAAERGTKIHDKIEAYLGGNADSEPFLETIKEKLEEHFGKQDWTSEESFGHELKFGGKVDLNAQNIVVDFKTKETPLENVVPYHEHIMQLAAYREGLKKPTARCAIVFVNAIDNEVKICEIPEDELRDGWECFKNLLSFYKTKNKLN